MLVACVTVYFIMNAKLNGLEDILEARKEADRKYKEQLHLKFSKLISSYESIIIEQRQITEKYEELHEKLYVSIKDFEKSQNRYDDIWQLIKQLGE